MLVQNATAATRDAVQLPTASSFRSCTEPALSSCCRFIPLPPLPPFLPPFFPTLLSITEGISRVSRSDFRDMCPRYLCVYIYIYISVFKTGKWQNSGNSGATSVFCKISRGTKLSGMAITGSLRREIRRISSTFACSLSRRDIKSYLRLRYVR